MPERTIQKIQTYDESHGRFAGRHYVEISYESWKSFDLNKIRTEVQCEINALLKNRKDAVFSGSEQGFCKPRKWEDDKEKKHFDLVFTPRFVRKIGIRNDLYVDMILKRVYSWDGNYIEIFPKRLVYGIMQIKPTTLSGAEFGTSGNLIKHNFKEEFFSKLVIEINRAYGFQLYNSTLILLRKLIENLLIDLLRTKYGMKKIDKFYNKDKGRHHDFSKLLENLDKDLTIFRPYSSAFEKPMINFLNKLRENSNSSAHSIDVQPNCILVLKSCQHTNHFVCLFYEQSEV